MNACRLVYVSKKFISRLLGAFQVEALYTSLEECFNMSSEVGQKIGTIVAMRVNKDVMATTKGKVTEVKVKDGQSVEYGQELFLVDTSDIV